MQRLIFTIKRKKIKEIEYSDKLNVSDEAFFKIIFEKDSYNRVVEAISKLRDIHKIPIYYHYVEGMKIKEIASLLNISQSAVNMM